MSKATPWKSKLDFSDDLIIEDNLGNEICDLWGNSEKHKERAELIVRAVNVHEDLIGWAELLYSELSDEDKAYWENKHKTIISRAKGEV